MREQHGPMMEDSSSLRFGNYDLIDRIDVGGMGEVYLARQRSAFGRKVAVKIIRSDLMHDFTARARFLREAEVSAHLQHEHILPLIEFSEDQGRLFLVTPYIEGGTLARRLQSGPLTLHEAHHLFVPLIQAVAYIHRRGVIHRDLKPTNILLDSQDGQIYVRLIDFGIASLSGQSASAPLTTAGNEVGTVAYMAPERLSGVAAPSNDIFSLGVILYQMLTGHFPTPSMRHGLPEPLEYVVRRCIAPRPEDRFANADEALQAFERAFQYLTTSAPSEPNSVSAPGVSGQSHNQFRRPASLLARSATSNPQGVDDFQLSAADENGHVSLLREVDIPVLELQPAEAFGQNDFAAPTTAFNPAKHALAVKPHGTGAAAPAVKTGPAAKRHRRRRGKPLLAATFILMALILMVFAGFLYYGYSTIAATTASISFGPKTLVVNPVYTLTASAQTPKVDVAAKMIPAHVLTNQKQGSQTGQTTGKTGCFFGLFCKQSVDDADVSNLVASLRPTLQQQITQELQGKIASMGGVQVGAFSFSDGSPTPMPAVGTVSKTVTVTLVETGNVGYIVKQDAQDLAQSLLSQQVDKGYHFISSSIQIGNPVVEGVDSSGIVTIKIAAGGVEQYTFPQAQLSNIAKHLVGLTTSAAQSYLQKQPGVDIATIAIRFTQGSGSTLPSDVQHIHVVTILPTTYPAVNLQNIPAPATPTSSPTASP